MTAIFDALPGIEVPVGEIAASLARMWDERADAGQPAPAADDVRATQVNFVLRFGRATTPEDALRQFHTTVRFATRYPSRVVVLCPLPPEDATTEMRAKIFGECFLGRTKSDARCCEFVLLSYPRSARDYLESQVSVCLTPDLPLYYWAHRFSACARLAEYRYLLTHAQRFLFDTAAAPADALTFPWPKPAAVRDLAFARTLPVRQSVGQFLSRYEPARLIDGLRTVTVAHDPALAAEGRALRQWLQDRLTACGPTVAVTFSTVPLSVDRTGSLELRFGYAGSSRFSWSGDVLVGTARFEADFGTGRTGWPASTSLLAPELALGEAMFS
ncbi:MAG TPA: glucose-6-phosphate dehydrogenase assembly protein OpcA [Opitutaceae bacterium]|nr:glucose-6-phosphate dehydrogenase assembly protein OpcA [Opitutaceae bacterium]